MIDLVLNNRLLSHFLKQNTWKMSLFQCVILLCPVGYYIYKPLEPHCNFILI